MKAVKLSPLVKIMVAVAGAVVLILALTMWLSAQRQTQDKVLVWRGWQGEAKHAPFYVAQQVLAEHGVQLSVRKNIYPPLPLAQYDTLILDQHSASLPAEQLSALQVWVEDGGHLIIPADNDLAHTFSLPFTHSPSAQQPLCTESRLLDWPSRNGSSSLSPMTQTYGQIVLDDGRLTSSTKPQRIGKVCQQSIFAAHFGVAAGQITALEHGVNLWSNDMPSAYKGDLASQIALPITLGDNMAYLHDLLADSQHALLVHGQVLPQLSRIGWQFPAVKWWPALLSLICGLLLLLWRFGQRFGPALYAEDSTANDMDRHLQAAGQYWQAHNGYAWLAQAMQQRLSTAFAPVVRRHGSEDAAMAWLARQTDLPSKDIRTLLHPEADSRALPQNEAEFIDYAAKIDTLRNVL